MCGGGDRERRPSTKACDKKRTSKIYGRYSCDPARSGGGESLSDRRSEDIRTEDIRTKDKAVWMNWMRSMVDKR